jgi:hypothetical protein
LNWVEPIILNGFEKILAAIEMDMPAIEDGILVKILGVIHFVAMRHIRNHDRLGNRKGREYITISLSKLSAADYLTVTG